MIRRPTYPLLPLFALAILGTGCAAQQTVQRRPTAVLSADRTSAPVVVGEAVHDGSDDALSDDLPADAELARAHDDFDDHGDFDDNGEPWHIGHDLLGPWPDAAGPLESGGGVPPTPAEVAAQAAQAAAEQQAAAERQRLAWPVSSRSILRPRGTFGASRSGGRRRHAGIDIGAPNGDPIAAIADGTVRFSGRNGGYGKLVIIDHGNGQETRYAHCSKLHVRVGDRVRRGQMIARVGRTGRVFGSAHLHFEIRRDGVALDPLRFLPSATPRAAATVLPEDLLASQTPR